MKTFSKTLLLLTNAAGALLAGDQTPALKTSGINLLAKINVQDDYKDSVVALPSILDTTTTEYAFGRTISRHAMAFQVHVDNASQEYQLLVHDIGLEICKRDDTPPKDRGKSGAVPQKELLQRPGDTFCPEGPFTTMSSMDKYVMQGLADRGQSQDPRNVGLRVITASVWPPHRCPPCSLIWATASRRQPPGGAAPWSRRTRQFFQTTP
jgi:hypothetical protein